VIISINCSDGMLMKNITMKAVVSVITKANDSNKNFNMTENELNTL